MLAKKPIINTMAGIAKSFTNACTAPKMPGP